MIPMLEYLQDLILLYSIRLNR